MNITWPEEPKEDTILQELENEFKRLQSLEDENWKSVRVDNIDSLYDKMQYEYEWGTRLFYTVKDSNQYKDYIDLQASRGLPHPQDYNWDWDEYFKHVHMDERDLNENDIKRVDSLEKILLENIFKVETWNETFNHTSGGIRNFIEIGFRSPELLKVLRIFLNTKGPERIVWGTDLPQAGVGSRARAQTETWTDIFKNLPEWGKKYNIDFTEEERDAICHGAAMQVLSNVDFSNI